MIPKIIHYCWFGGKEKNEKIRKCIDSWKIKCPDYKIIEWNEMNYDVFKNKFMKEAYEAGKWAFVSDYARVDIIKENGGIYLDTDVELISNLDSFLDLDFFAGFENEFFVNFGIGYGAKKGHSILDEILDYYNTIEFPNNDFGLSMISCPRIQTEILKKHGMICNNQNQVVEDCRIFSTEYFCPMSFKTGEIAITDKTVSIHHYDMSWSAAGFKKTKESEWKIIKIVGPKWGKRIASIVFFPKKLLRNAKDGTLIEYLCFLFKRK